jgi:hypothetical protein
VTRYTIHLTDCQVAEFNKLNLSKWERAERLLKSKVRFSPMWVSYLRLPWLHSSTWKTLASHRPANDVPLVFKKRVNNAWSTHVWSRKGKNVGLGRTASNSSYHIIKLAFVVWDSNRRRDVALSTKPMWLGVHRVWCTIRSGKSTWIRVFETRLTGIYNSKLSFWCCFA